MHLLVVLTCFLVLTNSLRNDEFEKLCNRSEVEISNLENKIEKGGKIELLFYLNSHKSTEKKN